MLKRVGLILAMLATTGGLSSCGRESSDTAGSASKTLSVKISHGDVVGWWLVGAAYPVARIIDGKLYRGIEVQHDFSSAILDVTEQTIDPDAVATVANELTVAVLASKEPSEDGITDAYQTTTLEFGFAGERQLIIAHELGDPEGEQTPGRHALSKIEWNLTHPEEAFPGKVGTKHLFEPDRASLWVTVYDPQSGDFRLDLTTPWPSELAALQELTLDTYNTGCVELTRPEDMATARRVIEAALVSWGPTDPVEREVYFDYKNQPASLTLVPVLPGDSPCTNPADR